MAQPRSNSAMQTAFGRITDEYGNRLPADPFGPTHTFSAARTYDKLIGLVVVALASAVVGYVAVPAGVAFACIVVAFGLTLLCWWRMHLAKFIAPVYSVLEGVALGAISAQYASFGHGVIPTAIAFTAAVFLGTLGLYRSGLVRVTPRMMSLAMVGAVGLVVVGLLSLVGLSIPSTTTFAPVIVIFALITLGIAVLNLFVDFDLVNRSEAMGLSADGEWAAAFAMMTALVLVYISVLRIAAVMYGGGGGRRR